MIERDVKQAVRLLEMSLSGLMSAETAVRRWKGQIPPKVRPLALALALLLMDDTTRHDRVAAEICSLLLVAGCHRAQRGRLSFAQLSQCRQWLFPACFFD